MNVFYNKGNMIKHQLICKQKNDPIRLMEIENNIESVLPDIKTECRFCNKNFCRTALLNKHFLDCTSKEEYHKMLIIKDTKRLEIVQQSIINNNIINNNITNVHNGDNKLILNFGQENLNHIQMENIIQLLREVRKEFGDNKVYLMAGDLITSFDNYIREIPENNNLLIPDSKCLYAETRIENGWEKQAIDQCLNKAFKSSAKELYKRKEEINETNKLVFESATNDNIFKEVGYFAKSGFDNRPDGNELRQIKSKFKVSKLKNKVILDF